MIRDQIKQYGDFSEFHTKCLCCEKTSHSFSHCPIIHYVPDRDFLIKKSNFNKEQIRKNDFVRKTSKKRMNNLQNIQENAIKATLSITEFLDNENEIPLSENPDENNIDEESVSLLNIKKESEKKIMDSVSKIESMMKFGQTTLLAETSLQKFPTNTLIEGVSFQEFIENESGSPKENNALEESKNLVSEKKTMKKTQRKSEREKIKEEFFLNGFDEIKSFSKYFPEGNVGNILGKIKKKRLLQNFATKKSLRMSLKVKSLKNYSIEGSPRIRPLYAKSNENFK